MCRFKIRFHRNRVMCMHLEIWWILYSSIDVWHVGYFSNQWNFTSQTEHGAGREMDEESGWDQQAYQLNSSEKWFFAHRSFGSAPHALFITLCVCAGIFVRHYFTAQWMQYNIVCTMKWKCVAMCVCVCTVYSCERKKKFSFTLEYPYPSIITTKYQSEKTPDESLAIWIITSQTENGFSSGLQWQNTN